jgi:hypothetical protein
VIGADRALAAHFDVASYQGLALAAVATRNRNTRTAAPIFNAYHIRDPYANPQSVL